MVKSGYIYLRSNHAYDMDDLYLLGSTDSLRRRDLLFMRQDLRKGKFVLVFEVKLKQMDIIKNLIYNKFKNLNRRADGGSDFFNKKIIDFIEQFLNEYNIKQKKLSEEEIENVIQTNPFQNVFQKIDKKKLINLLLQKEICHEP